MELNESDKKFIARINSMSLEQARRQLAAGLFGKVGSPNYDFVSGLVAVKEAEARDEQESRIESMSRKALRNSKWANIIAAIATIIAIIAIVVPWIFKN
jgi:hypothetical protein